MRDSSENVPVVPERVGQVLSDRWVLEAELGRGATGTVWEAHDRTTSERVAIKVLHDSLVPSPSARRRFQRELVNATALVHPHSIRVLGSGTTPDQADFLVMELVQGRTLSAVLAGGGALSQLRAIRIVAQILEATEAAHALGIVHRDLKPGNVLLVDGQDDFVKVCDYGLAKVIDARDEDAPANANAESFSTMRGMMCGTPAYMSPEQARGEGVDLRTDLYALGVMLFQMVVGRLPFEGPTPVDLVSAHLTATPPRPRELRPDLDIAPALEGLILRALAKDRRERPSSAAVFRADLLQIERDLVRDQRKRAMATAASRDGDTLPASGPAPRPRAAEPQQQPQPQPPPRARRGAVAVVGVGIVGLVALAVSIARSPTPAATVAPPPAPAPVAAAAPVAAPPPAPVAAPPRAEETAVAPSAPARAPLVAIAKPRASKRAPASGAAPAAAPPAHADLLERAEQTLFAGRLEDARVLGLAAAEHQPARADVWEFLGRCYMRLGRATEARTFYARYLALAPDGPKASFIRAIVSPDKGSRPE
jgi:serine/threonine-protein kinase